MRAVVDPDHAVRGGDETNNLSAVAVVSDNFTRVIPDMFVLVRA